MKTASKIKSLLDSYVGKDFPGCNFIITHNGKEISHSLGCAIFENPYEHGWYGAFSSRFRVNLIKNVANIFMPQITFPFIISERGQNLENSLTNYTYKLLEEG